MSLDSGVKPFVKIYGPGARNGCFEHICMSQPGVVGSREALRIVFMQVVPQEGRYEWCLWGQKMFTPTPIQVCPWCRLDLPRPDDLACNCGADEVLDRYGYRPFFVKHQFEFSGGDKIKVLVKASVIEFVHELECPLWTVTEMRT